MSQWQPDDLHLTQQVLAGLLEPINEDTTLTWLRHATQPNLPQGRRTHGQCGQIDLALLKRGLTLAQIAQCVSDATGTICTEERVKDHFKHLEEFWNGDMEPHHLRLREENGRWSFDREWIRQRALQGTVLRYDQPTEPVAEADWDALR